MAKLRDEGERLHLPYGLLQEVYKLEVGLSKQETLNQRITLIIRGKTFPPR